ncbi:MULTISPECIES: hypothetical protein [Enterococcus]|uniref:hypothetical protein n=1 Tax=Enterococcus TaxID=1350 RepID=UPI001106EE2B|nr:MULTISPECIES: hypothetical protein [Enterococcus]MDB1678914.1 hypothetical protein [Enterococcus durans]
MAQIWFERIIKLRRNYNRLMKGRYGKFDALNRLLLIGALLFSLFRRWLPFFIGYFVFALLIGVILYRFLSTKIYPRLNENQRFLKFAEQIKEKAHRFSSKQPKKTTVNHYTFFACPTCHQNQRAPKGKGRIRVTCKKCGTQFETKV